MIYLLAIGGGLLAGAALGFAWGLLAATLYSNLPIHQDGGPAMAGFFYVGPFGFFTGFLLAAAWILKYNQVALSLSRVCNWAALAVFALGMIIFLIPFASTDSRSSAQYTLTMQFSVPAASDPAHYRWGYQGHREEQLCDWQFMESTVEGDRRIFNADVSMSDAPPRRNGLISTDGKVQSFPIDVIGTVTQAYVWSEWVTDGDVKFRWQIH